MYIHLKKGPHGDKKCLSDLKFSPKQSGVVLRPHPDVPPCGAKILSIRKGKIFCNSTMLALSNSIVSSAHLVGMGSVKAFVTRFCKRKLYIKS